MKLKMATKNCIGATMLVTKNAFITINRYFINNKNNKICCQL